MSVKIKMHNNSKDRFARTVMNKIRQAGETEEIAYDPDQFTLSTKTVVLQLSHGYKVCCGRKKDERRKMIRTLVHTWLHGPEGISEQYAEARHHLMPVVRARSYFDLEVLRFEVDGYGRPNWPYQPLAEHLAAGLVYDEPEMMRTVCQEDLDQWNVTFDEAMEVAKENLRRRKHVFVGSAKDKGVYYSGDCDDYNSSRLLLPDLMGSLLLKGEPVALAPTRDSLIVAGSEDVSALEWMLAFTSHAMEKRAYPVSSVALRLSGDEWTPWLPEPSHPLYRDFKVLQVLSLGGDYEVQKDLLDRLHEKAGQDVFVASYMLIEKNRTGIPSTLAVWGKDVDPWLPRTDLIAFTQNLDERTRFYVWDKAVSVVGDLMERLEMYPERFKVSGFPTDEQFAAMGEEFVL